MNSSGVHLSRSPRTSRPPDAKLLAFFESLQDYVSTPACYGCPFLNVATEYPETDYPGHQVAMEHKQSVRRTVPPTGRRGGAKSRKCWPINSFC